MKQELEKIIKQALVDGVNHDITSQEIISDTTNKITEVYKPIVNSLKEATELNSRLLQEGFNKDNEILELKQKVEFCVQELSIKND